MQRASHAGASHGRVSVIDAVIGNGVVPGGSDGGDQGRQLRFNELALLDEGIDTGPLCSPPVLSGVRAGQNDDADVRPVLLETAGDRVAVEPRHVQVEQNDVRLFRGDQGERGLAVSCLAEDELELVIVGERRGDPEPEERVVVDDQNSHRPPPHMLLAHLHRSDPHSPQPLYADGLQR
jgi:hypothetical protein